MSSSSSLSNQLSTDSSNEELSLHLSFSPCLSSISSTSTLIFDMNELNENECKDEKKEHTPLEILEISKEKCHGKTSEGQDCVCLVEINQATNLANPFCDKHKKVRTNTPNPFALNTTLDSTKEFVITSCEEDKVKLNGFRLIDCNIIKNIGKGAGGFVNLIQHRIITPNVMYAVKCIKKDDEILLRDEKGYHSLLHHPNIVKMYGWYESSRYIYLLLEYCSGDDLFTFLTSLKYKRLCCEKTAVKFVKEIAQGVHYIHTVHNLIHKDLKLENILMFPLKERKHKLKIADFGFSNKADNYLKGVIGTADYIAPETLLEKTHTKAVDIWALGVITYELLVGRAPFNASSKNDTFEKIANCPPDEYPKHIKKNISKEAHSFITSLLTKDPKQRPTIEEVLEHSWLNPGLHQKQKK